MRFLFFILYGSIALAQNLVQNPSFEMHSSCPSVTSQLNLANFWAPPTNHTGTPDYLNTCGTWDGIQVPANNFGYQQPYEGNAYAGIHIYAVGPTLFDNYREYLQTRLSTPLTAGENYLISFYISRGEYFRFGCNNMGAALTVAPIVGTGTFYPLNATPAVLNQNIVTSGSGWTLISGNYLASGNEEYLTIGNFFDNSSTSATVVYATTDPQYYTAYYYVDNVSVVQTPLNIDEFTNQELAVYPNPVVDKFTIASSRYNVIKKIELYSQICKLSSFNIDDNTLNIGDLPSGVYYLTVTFDSNKKSTTKIIKL